MTKIKVGVMEDIKKMNIRMMEIPKLGDNQVLAKIHQCNICTTDWQTWAGLRKSQGREFPWACGHEMAGEIIEVGNQVPNYLKPGMHVGFGSQGSNGCGECTFCRNGHPSRCINKPKEYEHEGVVGSFGMSQYVVYDSHRVYPISNQLPYEEACYLEPTASSVHGIKRLKITPSENILVIGAGNLGLVNAQVAQAYGGRVMVSEISEERCQISKSLGFYTVNPKENDLREEVMEFTNGKGMDAVIVAVGNNAANEQAISVLGLRGRVLVFAAGYPEPFFNVSANLIHYKEYELIGAFSTDPSDYEVASSLLGDGKVKVDKLISHKVPLDDIQHAFELAATPGNYRVSISMW